VRGTLSLICHLVISPASNALYRNLASLLGGKTLLPKGRILGDGLWVSTGQVASALGTLVGVRLLTELVPPDVFGAVSLFLGMILLGSNLTCSPIFQATLRLYPELALEGKVNVLRAAVQRLLSVVVIVLLGFLLLGGLIHSVVVHRVIWTYIPMIALLLIDTARGLEVNFLAAARQHRPFALWSAFEAWGRPIGAMLAVLFWKPTPEAVLMGYCLASGCGYLVFRYKSTPEGLLKQVSLPHVRSSLDRQIWAYAMPLIPLALVIWISSLGDRFIVGGILGLDKVGIYAAAYGLVSKPFLILGNILTLTLRPIYFEAVSRQDEISRTRILSFWVRMTGLLCLVGVLAFAVSTNLAASLLLAHQYRGAAAIMPWIALGYAFYILASVFEQVIYAQKQTGWLLRMHLAVGTFSLACGGLGVWWFGLFGAALACPAYFLFHLIIAAWLSKKGHFQGRAEIDESRSPVSEQTGLKLA
jgi:O-antigen/teichoic acid export membrane protein